MANSPEENRGFGWIKPAALVLGIGAAGAWFGAEPVAKYLIGEPPEAPETPQAPERPQRVTATRGPMEVVVGFDVTKSPIVHDLPFVTAATRQFFAQTGVLRPNDKVDICTFAEYAKCQNFTMPGDRSALDAAISQIGPDPRPGSKMQTYVHRSVRQMVSQVAGEAIVLAWSDCMENEEGPKSPLPPNHPPVTLVVPQEKYIPGAQSVDGSLGDIGVDVALARDSEEFGETLERFSAALDQRAQGLAQARADAKHRAKMIEYGTKMAEYEEALADNDRIKAEFAAAKVAAEERIAAVKRTIKIIAASFLAVCTLIIGTIEYLRRRPKTHGWILDLRARYSETYRVHSQPKPLSLSRISNTLPNIYLQPKRDGLYFGEQRLKSGDQLTPNIYWFEKEPDTAAIKVRQQVKK